LDGDVVLPSLVVIKHSHFGGNLWFGLVGEQKWILPDFG
jgi:hypothetical protein